LSAINSNWLYTKVGPLDPWYNVAYFLHYDDPSFLNDIYKIARLSWIIPGFVAYQVFSPVVANYVLHMGCLVISVVFLFLTLHRLFGYRIAFATAACLAIYVPFHGSGGWDYQNAPASAYYIVAYYFITTGALSDRGRNYLFVAGVAFAAAVHATISFVNLVPVLGLHFLVLYRHRFGRFPSARELVRLAIRFAAGAVALTLVLGLINVSIGRDFLFFRILVEILVSRVIDSSGNAAWWMPWSSWWFIRTDFLGELQYFYFGGAVFVTCASVVIFAGLIKSRVAANSIALSVQFQYLLSAAIWAFLQSSGQVALQPDYFAYPLIPAIFLAIAGSAATWQQHELSSQNDLLFSCAVALTVIVSLGAHFFLTYDILHLISWHPLGLSVGFAFLGCVLFPLAKSHGFRLFLAVTAFSAANLLTASQSTYLEPDGSIGEYSSDGSPCVESKSRFVALIDSNRFLISFDRNLVGTYAWWDDDEVLSDRQGCALSLRAFAASMSSFNNGLFLASPYPSMPAAEDLPENIVRGITVSKRIAVPTANPATIDRLIARYERSGVKLAIQGRRIIRTSRFGFYLYVLGVQQGHQTPDLPQSSPQRRVLSGPMASLPLESLQALNGGALSAADGAVVLTTPAQQWAYAASGVLRLPARAEGPAVLRVRVQVEQGRLGIGVLARGDTSQMLDEQAEQVTSAPVELYLYLTDVHNAGMIVFRSWSPTGEVTRARIVSIETTLERPPPEPVVSGPITTVPLDTLQALNGGTLSAADEAVVLTTPAQQWAYAASGALRLPARAEGPGVLRVRLQVEQGQLGIGVLARGDTSQMLDEKAENVTSSPVDLYLYLTDVQKSGLIVFRSWSSTGKVTRARIVSIETMLERGPPQQRP
jgi:hypothetical protein